VWRSVVQCGSVVRCVVVWRSVVQCGAVWCRVMVRGIVAFYFSPRNLTQVTSAMKKGQGVMIDFTSVKRVSLREGLY